MSLFPPNIKAVRASLPGGAVEYKLSHPEVGELGRIIVIPSLQAGGPTEIRHEIFSGLDDGHHERRKALLVEVERSVGAAFRRAGVAWK